MPYDPRLLRWFASLEPAERLAVALEAADGSVQRASSLGRYQLSQIQLTCSLKAGFVVLDVSGALTLSWTLPKPTPGAGGTG